jgi:Family of unknown function (DUF6459)
MYTEQAPYAERALAAPESLPIDLSAIRQVPVPDWAPPDCGPDASAPPGPAYGAASARPSDQADAGQPWPRQFAVLLAEVLAGARPLQQILPWMSKRGSIHLHRVLPLFGNGHRPRVLRVLTATPSADVVEMTLIVAAGPRARALAIRLERTRGGQHPVWRDKLAAQWLCTDIEAA